MVLVWLVIIVSSPANGSVFATELVGLEVLDMRVTERDVVEFRPQFKMSPAV
jgi:hypothetical protein